MIPITYLRSSSYNTHSLCSQRYFGEYILGWTGPAGASASRGTVFHKIMELLALSKQHGIYTDDEIQITLDSSNLNIDEIIQAVYNYYTKTITHHEWNTADFKEIEKWCTKTLASSFNPCKLNIIEAEVHFDFEIKQDWAKYEYEIKGKKICGYLRMKGTIDLLVELSEGVYEVIDWKTGKYKKDWATNKDKNWENLHDDFQLRLYHLAIHKLYPKINDVLVTINYVNAGGPETIHLHRSNIPETLDMIYKKFNEIKNADKLEVLYEKSPYDKWKCKFCHAYKHTFEGTSVKPIIESRHNQITPIGETMSICEQLKYVSSRRDLSLVIEHMSNQDFNIQDYISPGG